MQYNVIWYLIRYVRCGIMNVYIHVFVYIYIHIHVKKEKNTNFDLINGNTEENYTFMK